MATRLKPTTMENKKHIFETKLRPFFGDAKVCDIDTIAVRKWQNQLINFRDSDNKPYSQTYIKMVNTQLSAIFNYAVRNYGLPSNPCLSAGPIGKSQANEMKIWTREEFQRALSYEAKSYYHLAFNLLFWTGIREGELLALTPQDILPTKQLDIHRTYAVIRGVGILQDTKTEKSRRKVAVPDFLYDELTSYISMLYCIKSSERIFFITKSGLQKEIKRLADCAGLPQIRVHDLRHSHASMLIDMGVEILEISRRLGHKSAKTTLDTYGHLYPDKDIQLASRLNDIGCRRRRNQLRPAKVYQKRIKKGARPPDFPYI